MARRSHKDQSREPAIWVDLNNEYGVVNMRDFWVTRDREPIAYYDMDLSHVLNALRLMVKRMPAFDTRVRCELLCTELRRREWNVPDTFQDVVLGEETGIYLQIDETRRQVYFLHTKGMDEDAATNPPA